MHCLLAGTQRQEVVSFRKSYVRKRDDSLRGAPKPTVKNDHLWNRSFISWRQSSNSLVQETSIVLHCAFLLRIVSCVVSVFALKTQFVFLYAEPS